MRILAPLLLVLVVLTGCRQVATWGHRTARPPRPAPTLPPAPEEPAVTHYTLHDGRTGRPATWQTFLREASGADLVVFGELHGHPVGAALELALLQHLSRCPRPVALAMEFFERDTQAALDAYLAGEMDRAAFVEATRRSPDYDRTHGPLVDWARRHGHPVIAANAPRRLVRGYRKSGLEYEAYLESLDESDRALLPAATSTPRDAYWERFQAIMGPMADAFFGSQALWDDAMGESMAAFRDAHPRHRVMFVVGGFHVTERLGTITKYLQRRPNDRVAVALMSAGSEPGLRFEENDAGSADLVVKVRPPPPPDTGGENPHAPPPNPHEAAPPPPATPPEDAAPSPRT